MARLVSEPRLWASRYTRQSRDSDRDRATLTKALTPRNDESDCRVRAANDAERREVPHVIHVLRDGE